MQFKTYAYTRIRGAVLDELRRNCPLPQNMLQQVARVRKAYDELPPPVTAHALALATGLSEEDVADSLAAIRLTRLLSLEDHAQPIGTRLDDVGRPDLLAEKEEQKRLLVEALGAGRTRAGDRDAVLPGRPAAEGNRRGAASVGVARVASVKRGVVSPGRVHADTWRLAMHGERAKAHGENHIGTVVSGTCVHVSADRTRVHIPGQEPAVEPRIEIIRSGDVIQAIDIVCGCGQHIRLQCLYKETR